MHLFLVSDGLVHFLLRQVSRFLDDFFSELFFASLRKKVVSFCFLYVFSLFSGALFISFCPREVLRFLDDPPSFRVAS